MPPKDPSKTGKRTVDRATGDNPAFDAQTIIADPALRARLRDAKEEIARTTKKRRYQMNIESEVKANA